MRLSRDKIQRMINAGGGSSSGGGGGSDIAGGVTQAWVNQNYVSIEFFRKVFKVWAAGETSSDPDVEIMPNDITTTVKNIQAQAGLWTEAFLSALGQGSGGGTGGATTLDQLDDVVITSPTNGQALIYNATTQMWVNGTIQSGTDMTTVWSALAAATNEQINASHLSGVLADYVTTTSLQTILGDYLTQTSADQRYITIAYFDRLFRAYNGDTLVSHNDTTTTIDNIKAMFGFWTDLYISALGRNSAATGLGIDNLTDVTINTPTDGQVLTYDAVSGKWVNANGGGGNYLPINGGTLTGELVIKTSEYGSQLTIYRDDSNYDPAIKFQNLDDGHLGYIGISGSSNAGLSKKPFVVLDRMYEILYSGNIKTINGQSIIGTGDISVGGGASGNFLPLSGGTLTNANFGTQLIIKRDAPYDSAIAYHNSGGLLGYIGITSNKRTFFYDISGISHYFVFEDTTGVFLPLTGGTLTGNLTINAKTKGYGCEFGLIEIPSNQNILQTISTYKLYLNYDRNGDVILCYGGGNVGVKTSSPSYALHVAGTIYATGAITALSDARKKDITGEAGVTVEQIAQAPAVQFLWKDKERRKDGHQVGTLAQYWQTVLPEVVMDKGGELSMQYGVAALVSAITIARKVIDHEQRIKLLEQENEELKKQLNAA